MKYEKDSTNNSKRTITLDHVLKNKIQGIKENFNSSVQPNFKHYNKSNITINCAFAFNLEDWNYIQNGTTYTLTAYNGTSIQDIYIPSKIIQDGVNGYLVRCFDIDMMANKINYLIENPNVRIDMSSNTLLDKDKLQLENIIFKWKKIIFS